MRWVIIISVLVFFLFVNATFAITGNTSLEVYVNPCNVFLTQISCEASGCYWWDSSCHESPAPSEGTIGPAVKNYTISVIVLTDPVITPGNFSFIINLTNERNYEINGILDYWVENHLTKKRYFEHSNETMTIAASSVKKLDRSIFLLLPVGDYFLKAEFTRIPIEIKEKITDQKSFSVTSALGWTQPTKPLEPSEIAIIVTFLVLIVIFGYGIYTIISDFYSYTFSE